MANVQNMSHQTISLIATGVGILTLVLTVLTVIAGGAYWAGKIDTRIDAQDGQIQTLFDEQDRRLEIQFNGLEKSIEAVDERIEARIDPYGYHHHAEDGAVLFVSSPEGR